jgi:hypothetical protein
MNEAVIFEFLPSNLSGIRNRQNRLGRSGLLLAKGKDKQAKGPE